MVWAVVYVAVILSPFVLLWALTVSESRKQARQHKNQSRPAAVKHREQPPLDPLTASVAALEAQFLIAPHTAIRQARALLDSFGVEPPDCGGPGCEHESPRRCFEQLVSLLEQIERAAPKLP